MDENKIKKKRKVFYNKEKEKQEYDPFDRYLDLAKELRYERKKNKISYLINIILVIVMIYMSLRNIVHIYVVERDSQTRAILNTTELKKSNNELTEKDINYFLGRFVLDSRSIPLDEKFYEKKLKESNLFLTPTTQEKLKIMLENENSYEKLKIGITVNVAIKTINKMTGETNTYQVRWEEKQFRHNGELELVNHYAGIFTIDNVEVKNEEMAGINPYGIVIKDFNISKENQ